MTLKVHLDVLKEQYYRGVPSDDRRLPDKFFERILYAVRNQLIKERLKNGEYVSDDAYSYICVDLENSSYHTCNCAENTCQYKRSIYKLPNILNSKKGLALSVLNLNGEVLNTSEVDTNLYEKKYRLNDLANQDIAWFYQNHYLFLLNAPHVKKVIVKAIFSEDFTNLEICNNNDNACVYPGSQSSFIPSDLEAKLYQLSLELIMSRTKKGQDRFNDNVDNIETDTENIRQS